MYIKQCCCGSYDPRQVQVPPVDDAEGIKQYRLSTKCHFSSSWEGRAPLAFVALRQERRPDGVGARGGAVPVKIGRWVFQFLEKYTVLTF